MRKVINKMVTEEDLIRTVTDRVRRRLAPGEAVLHVRPAHRDRRGRPADRRPGPQGHQAGPRGLRHPRHPLHGLHRRVRAQAAHPLPVGRRSSTPRTTDARLAKLRDAIRADRNYGKAIGFRYHDGKPGIIEGLLSRGDRRVGAVIRAVWEDGGRFDGWSEHFSYDRWMAAPPRRVLADTAGRRRLVHHPRARATTRSCPGTTSTPAWTGTGCGRTGRTLARRGRGRGLPLDAVLRLRRVPADGHRDPDRARPG